MGLSSPGFGLYIHWPFCKAKCPYCDFNSHVRFGGIDEARFLAAFLRELEHTAERVGARQVESIFFGGGTPSLMQPGTVAAILDKIAALWSVDPNAEITLEANPGSVEAGRFRGYRAAGVNRVSLGVQSLRDGPLSELGRRHTVEAMGTMAHDVHEVRWLCDRRGDRRSLAPAVCSVQSRSLRRTVAWGARS